MWIHKTSGTIWCVGARNFVIKVQCVFCYLWSLLRTISIMDKTLAPFIVRSTIYYLIWWRGCDIFHSSDVNISFFPDLKFWKTLSDWNVPNFAKQFKQFQFEFKALPENSFSQSVKTYSDNNSHLYGKLSNHISYFNKAPCSIHSHPFCFVDNFGLSMVSGIRLECTRFKRFPN